MILIRRAILAFALIAGITPAIAQIPSPVPALPDTERRTSYSISGTTCACNLNFALYGDSTDYQNWVEVYLNGIRVNYNDATFGWTITSPTGALGSIALPITDAVLTFTNAQTGTVQIVGARRPRRVSQFSENQGVPARNLNQALTDIVAQNREIWDKTNDMTGRGMFSQPGNTVGPLPLPAVCANAFLGFDATGLNPTCLQISSTGSIITPGSVTDGDFALWSGTGGKTFKDGGAPGTFAFQNYATPPAIGGTTPNAGSFSSIKDTGITGSTQCVQANSAGTLSGAGLPCIINYNLTNLLSNTGFQYVPGLAAQAKYNNQGSGTLGTFAVTSTSNSFNIATINITPNAANQIKPNFMVQLGSGCVSQLLPIQFGSSGIFTALRVLTTTGSPVSSFTVLVPKYTGTAVGTGTCTGTVVTPTDFGTAVQGPANWLKTASAYLWMENDPVNYDPLGGSIQVVGVQQRSSAAAILYTTLAAWRTTALQGQPITCGGRIMQKISGGAGTARFFINDTGTITYGAAMPLNVGNFQSIQSTATISTTSTSISAGYEFDDTTGSTFFETKPYCVAAPASAVPTNFYSAPINETVYPDRIHNVWDYSATTVTFPSATYSGSITLPYYAFLIDLMGETQGSVHWTTPVIIGDMEGQSTATHTSLITLNAPVPPTTPIPGGSIMWLPVASSTNAVTFQQPLTNGMMIWGTGQSATVLSAANLDLYGVILNTGPSGQ